MDHCPRYTVYWDHCLYDFWTTVQQLLQEIHRTIVTQAVLVFCIRSNWRWASIQSGQLLILDLKSQLFAEYLSFYTVSSYRPDFFHSSCNTDRNYPRSTLLYCMWRVISGLNYFSGRVYSIQFDGYTRCKLWFLMNTLNVSNINGKIKAN